VLTRLLALFLCIWPALACAQADYPNRAVRIVAPFPPGQGTELIARILAQQFSQSTGQPFFVDNKPGAAAIIGTEIVKNSPPDGYTLLVAGSGPLAINASLYAKLPYDPIRDFQPIGMIGIVPNILVVPKDFPANTLAELIAQVRQNPDKLNFGSSGVGVPNHLIMEMLKAATGMRITHVPYKGASASITALLSGEIAMMFETVAAVIPHVKSGRLKVLAVAGPKRALSLPEVPTVAESGVPGFSAQGWSAMLAPAGTPKNVVDRLHAELKSALAKSEVRQRLSDLGVEPVDFTLEQTAAYMRSELENWARAVKVSGARAD
jgi:tripartite-type tricarboxylate transporter receptor subunit TctC